MPETKSGSEAAAMIEAKEPQDCRGCFWVEGGRCYLEPVERNHEDGRSTKPAIYRCGSYSRRGERSRQQSTREEVLEALRAINPDRLTDFDLEAVLAAIAYIENGGH